MVKKILFLIFVLFLVACAPKQIPIVKEELEMPPVEKTIQEEYPETISSEEIKAKTCIDECTKSACIDLAYYECVQSNFGCGVLDKKGIISGKCGVTCLVDEDCEKGMECELGIDYTKCVED